jgi:UDPglucose 6-dehydrogenase
MGTTINDFLNPEFVLIGAENRNDALFLEKFYDFIKPEKILMDIESAELTKVAYNTFIGFKIVFANTIAEITELRGGDPDIITSALSRANGRLMSSAYMRAGMGDGGGCHPRDQIAMSWLAKESKLSTDLFEYLATARDSQTEKQANLVKELAEKHDIPVAILGVAYKANSPLDIGSPARLLEFYLIEKGVNPKIIDHWILKDNALPANPHIFFIGVMHSEFKNLNLPSGSIVIDPWGFVESVSTNVTLVTPGRNKVNQSL